MRTLLFCLLLVPWTTTSAIIGRHRKEQPRPSKQNSIPNICDQKTQGIALLAADRKNPTVGCEVTLLLEGNTLQILKGNTDLHKLNLTKLKTPILVKTDECFSLSSGKEEHTLCFFNKYSRDSWWMAITKQILCNHQGKSRNEVYGEASLEEVQMDIESLNKKGQKTGVNIHIDGYEMEHLPQVKVHYKE